MLLFAVDFLSRLNRIKTTNIKGKKKKKSRNRVTPQQTLKFKIDSSPTQKRCTAVFHIPSTFLTRNGHNRLTTKLLRASSRRSLRPVNTFSMVGRKKKKHVTVILTCLGAEVLSPNKKFLSARGLQAVSVKRAPPWGCDVPLKGHCWKRYTPGEGGLCLMRQATSSFYHRTPRFAGRFWGTPLVSSAAWLGFGRLKPLYGQKFVALEMPDGLRENIHRIAGKYPYF